MSQIQQEQYIQQLGINAKQASYALANLTASQKAELLKAIADALTQNTLAILAANAKDVAAAKADGLTYAMIDRLLLDEARLASIIGDISDVIRLADPVGEEFGSQLLDNGLRLTRRRVPLGVIGVIYEARPNVTVDIAVLALKTGNAVILRGGKETLQSNKLISDVIRSAVVAQGLPIDAVQFIDSPDRALVTGLLKLDQYVDMIVPRGGQALQRLCAEQATIPVILGGIGICHLYVDKNADLERALAVIANAKVQRPTVCNALDTLLVDERVASTFVPQIAEYLHRLGVRFSVCEQTYTLLDGLGFDLSLAKPEDFGIEWLSLTIGIKVVSDIDAAIGHIRHYSSGHSEAILTDDIHAAAHFMNEVNSAAVYVNASTRFTDGGQFGLGAEVAVSTQKLHARGPMGLEALTTYKWLAWGDYTSRV
ncbi:glutamate-5-semialdehyde dehydrogenase [Shewanella glacialipiscicola]|uniref:glutamate-5-semialdehyde dehydrogenase n=1 Tax=Shewanella glacialipiscicola TaxID=614069 RepID=UPI001BC1A745|nr:glutamate-5-semialdehyde dehydrogenase [Shewanella glacialipiscicola]MCL1087024.1 glutamate-5-semialdehyde dehydrogenase [Shewanella glacialipiscicola]MCU7995716.1 glutamate-5-semialdehyde dehydrogenase [Shewanella glacialipiscicola]MCU8026963.1 glutamate-5-semialdehyde dehydrogenase [Shewanella glacialipiscicola]GIU04721.1 gamma-glutamyl phosphate reductase [Shewanella glacialipiscicola]